MSCVCFSINPGRRKNVFFNGPGPRTWGPGDFWVHAFLHCNFKNSTGSPLLISHLCSTVWTVEVLWQQNTPFKNLYSGILKYPVNYHFPSPFSRGSGRVFISWILFCGSLRNQKIGKKFLHNAIVPAYQLQIRIGLQPGNASCIHRSLSCKGNPGREKW